MSALTAVRLLGAPTVTIAGAAPPPELLWRKHLGLCLVLWCSPGRQRTRDQLLGLLWSGKPESAARHSLNEALRVIRRVAGADSIAADVAGVRWTGMLRLDLDDFAACEHTDPAAAAAIVAGDFCDGFTVPDADEFERWVDIERRSVRSRLVAVLARAAAAAENRSDIGQNLALADRAVRLDALSDVAARAMMRARWLAGDRGGAVQFGMEFQAFLARELGTRPDEATTALLERISAQRRPVHDGPEPVAPRRPPLVARESVISRLVETWRAARPIPRPVILVISGPAGSGRSRILDELAERARLDGSSVAFLRALSADRDDAAAPLLGLAASGLHLARGVSAAAPQAVGTFASQLPQWSEQFPHAGGDALPIREAFTAIVHAAASEQPVLLAIDDAERLGDRGIEELFAVLRLVADSRVTLAVTINDRADGASIDELRRRVGHGGAGTIVQLEPLDVESLAQLVGDALPEWESDARQRLARRLHAESAGLPAIAVEVLGAVVAGMALDPEVLPWPAADRTLDATLPANLPGTLVAAIRLAFRDLAAADREALQVAALLPEPFPAARLDHAIEFPDVASRDAVIDRLEWAGWLVSDGRGYSFPARMVRTLLAEEMLTPGARRRLEAKLAVPERESS